MEKFAAFSGRRLFIAMCCLTLALSACKSNEGKPEAALPKIVEGRVQGFFKEVALLEQPYAKDDSKSVSQFIGSATIVQYAQVEIG